MKKNFFKYKSNNKNQDIEKLNRKIFALKILSNQGYKERNKLVLFLSKIFPSYRVIDVNPEVRYRNVICIEIGNKLLTWHIPERDLRNFSELELRKVTNEAERFFGKYHYLLNLTLEEIKNSIS